MKSEKAKEAIERYRKTFSAPYEVDETTEYCRLFEEISEIAEQEAEERMRQKAVKAYCHDCCCTVAGECGIGSENCIALRDFIQKLNEE